MLVASNRFPEAWSTFSIHQTSLWRLWKGLSFLLCSRHSEFWQLLFCIREKNLRNMCECATTDETAIGQNELIKSQMCKTGAADRKIMLQLLLKSIECFPCYFWKWIQIVTEWNILCKPKVQLLSYLKALPLLLLINETTTFIHS